MQKQTKSLLEELQSIGDSRGDVHYIIESRALNVIASAINLIEYMQKYYPSEKVELLEKKMLSAIRNKDQSRFSKSIRKKKRNE